jgi:hypothetical protein
MVMHLIVAGAASPLFRRPRWRCHRFHRISRYSSLVISFFPFSRLCAYSFLSTSSQRFFHDDDQVDFRTVRTPSPLTFAECIKEEVYPAKPRGVWTLKPRPACHERRRRANHRRALVRASLRLADSSTYSMYSRMWTGAISIFHPFPLSNNQMICNAHPRLSESNRALSPILFLHHNLFVTIDQLA